MNEDRKTFRHDEGLRRAIAKRELQLPRMSDDLNQRLMQRMGRQKTLGKRRWLGAIAAGIAVAVVLIGGWLAIPSGRDMASTVLPKEKQPAATFLVAQTENRSVAKGAVSKRSVSKRSVSQEEPKQEETRLVVGELRNTSVTDSTELTDVQKAMSDYVAQLSQTCGATCLPLDCDSSEGKVYVFQDDEQTDVLGRLKSVVAWIDTDSPAVRLFSASNQMTLELDGTKGKKGVNDIWLADRQYGYVYLYHARVREDSWVSASCYTAFLDQNSRKLSN